MEVSLAPARYAISELVCHALWSGWAPLHGNPGVEMAGVISRSSNSKRPLMFAHVVLTKTLGVHWAQEIQDRIPGTWTSGRRDSILAWWGTPR